MNIIIPKMLILTLSFITINSLATVNIVECEDEVGNRSFQKTCPPNSSVVREKKIFTGTTDTADEATPSDINAILYSVPNCDTCDEVREFLQNRKITIAEKDVNSDIDSQTELKNLTGGLKVPSVKIGEKTIIGYNRKELKEALEKAGYKEEGS